MAFGAVIFVFFRHRSCNGGRRLSFFLPSHLDGGVCSSFSPRLAGVFGAHLTIGACFTLYSGVLLNSAGVRGASEFSWITWILSRIHSRIGLLSSVTNPLQVRLHDIFILRPVQAGVTTFLYYDPSKIGFMTSLHHTTPPSSTHGISTLPIAHHDTPDPPRTTPPMNGVDSARTNVAGSFRFPSVPDWQADGMLGVSRSVILPTYIPTYQYPSMNQPITQT